MARETYQKKSCKSQLSHGFSVPSENRGCPRFDSGSRHFVIRLPRAIFGCQRCGNGISHHALPDYALRTAARTNELRRVSSQAPFDLLLGVPIDCSGAFVGCQRMPWALRAAAGALGIRDAGGNLQVTIADPVRDPDTGVIGLRDVVAASEVLRSTLTDLLAKGRRPLLLGGDTRSSDHRSPTSVYTERVL